MLSAERASTGVAVIPVFEQMKTLKLQNEKLRAVRNLLLPRLMSGEIAV
ncbi:MAG TPA: hypothetical protein VJ180_08305 [Pyrinomonadaceae bacterium]|nr:hypothetical protein [Pyrinomonadaceae bacterium]